MPLSASCTAALSAQATRHASRDMSASGGLLQRVAYTADSKFLLCCSGNVIKIFSTATGTQVRVLEGHTAEVTAVAHRSTSVLQAFSASLDGRLLLWDLDEAIVLRSICIGLSIVDMALDAARPDVAFVLTSENVPTDVPGYCQGLAGAGRVCSVALRVSDSQAAWAATQLARGGGGAGGTESSGRESFGTLKRPWPAEVTTLFKAQRATALAAATCGGNSSVVGALNGKMLRLHDVATGTTTTVNFAGRHREITCLAVSPSQRLAATGDEKGRIHLWRIEGGNGSPPRASEMHWHAQRVGALAFSADGLYLYSAGREGVLVSWQLTSTHRNYLPRLGAPLTSLACSADSCHAALLGTDNTVRLVDLQTNSVRLHVHGLLQVGMPVGLRSRFRVGFRVGSG